MIGTKDTINASIKEDTKLEIPYKYKYLKVEFSLPKAPLGNTKQVQYKLDGLDNEWSKWNYLSELNFPGLASGNYTLELRARSENEGESKILKKEFYVKYPWYFSKIAFFLYFLLFVIINVLYSYFFKKHNKKKIKLIQDKEQDLLEKYTLMDTVKGSKERGITRIANTGDFAAILDSSADRYTHGNPFAHLMGGGPHDYHDGIAQYKAGFDNTITDRPGGLDAGYRMPFNQTPMTQTKTPGSTISVS